MVMVSQLISKFSHSKPIRGSDTVHVIIAFNLLQRTSSEIPLLDHLTLDNNLRAMARCLSVLLGPGQCNH
ncbi:hypothetical protein CR513_50711, partial [Mucuna pruriens]